MIEKDNGLDLVNFQELFNGYVRASRRIRDSVKATESRLEEIE